MPGSLILPSVKEWSLLPSFPENPVQCSFHALFCCRTDLFIELSRAYEGFGDTAVTGKNSVSCEITTGVGGYSDAAQRRAVAVHPTFTNSLD